LPLLMLLSFLLLSLSCLIDHFLFFSASKGLIALFAQIHTYTLPPSLPPSLLKSSSHPYMKPWED
jgi:hypothetical protein